MATDKEKTLQLKFSEKLRKEKCEKLEDWCTDGRGDTILNMVTYVAVVGYFQEGAVPIFLDG